MLRSAPLLIFSFFFSCLRIRAHFCSCRCFWPALVRIAFWAGVIILNAYFTASSCRWGAGVRAEIGDAVGAWRGPGSGVGSGISGCAWAAALALLSCRAIYSLIVSSMPADDDGIMPLPSPGHDLRFPFPHCPSTSVYWTQLVDVAYWLRLRLRAGSSSIVISVAFGRLCRGTRSDGGLDGRRKCAQRAQLVAEVEVEYLWPRVRLVLECLRTRGVYLSV